MEEVSAPTLFRGAAFVADLRKGEEVQDRHSEGAACPGLVVYYDSTCGHCRTMAPRLANFSEIAQTDSELKHVIIGAVDCASQDVECREKNVTEVPALFIVPPRKISATDKPGNWSTWLPLPSTIHTTDDVLREVKRVLYPINVVMPPTRRDVCASIGEYFAHQKKRQIAAMNSSQQSRSAAPFAEVRAFHEVDIAASFFYTMYHEVPMIPLVSDTVREALEGFLHVVAEILPGIKADFLLAKLRELSSKGVVTATEWKSAVIDARIPLSGVPPHHVEWLTCRGSDWNYRGFTCGLWLMYHALTVNAHDAHNSFIALKAIRRYALTYFACGDCRAHFSQFRWAPEAQHRFHWTAATQLWAAHNQVNRRLAREVDGADPKVPKRLFPDITQCPHCFLASKNGNTDSLGILPDDQQKNEDFIAATFDLDAVERFLQSWYQWNATRLAVESEDCGGDTCPLVRPPVDKGSTDGSAEVRLKPSKGRVDILNPILFSLHRKDDHKDVRLSLPPTSGQWYVKTRHPLFVVKRDPWHIHFLLTAVVVTSCVLGGFYFVRRGASSWKKRGTTSYNV